MQNNASEHNKMSEEEDNEFMPHVEVSDEDVDKLINSTKDQKLKTIYKTIFQYVRFQNLLLRQLSRVEAYNLFDVILKHQVEVGRYEKELHSEMRLVYRDKVNDDRSNKRDLLFVLLIVLLLVKLFLL